ncbi:protein WHAT'S THIS FACTOR 1 homolog isoform X2 [Olea europaea var. sylvestris]|uniref:protein WHAT'S THIS FACTOR 1 homolog isoform X2 n=1 Tax=Olea europaea var. sylvestris TaxID=158386 RepID=UPI000C1D00AB|nr:protein WHAT'S THIS FACTOR 1 homolog isoform X2 [Olea europaea var. sylvestris]
MLIFSQLHKFHKLVLINRSGGFKASLGYTWVQIMHKTTGGRKPKKKIYHRVHELDRVMELQKKPSLILQLKSIIQSQKKESLLLRDLEKEVGFVQKWNYMAVIEKYPSIFVVIGGKIDKSPPAVMLSEKAKKIADLEAEATVQMEPILVKNLRKLLMLSVDCRVPLETIEMIGNEMGLPSDFKQSIIPKYPQFFSLKDVSGRWYLDLENWDSSLAVTAREERLAREGLLNTSGHPKRAKISKDVDVLFSCLILQFGAIE